MKPIIYAIILGSALYIAWHLIAFLVAMGCEDTGWDE